MQMFTKRKECNLHLYVAFIDYVQASATVNVNKL
jgi:hypothetical protein